MDKPGQKGLTLKIAAGVFIGIMAALLVYSIPGWIRTHLKEQRDREALERELWVVDMKPEQFSARCGKLLKDELIHDFSVPRTPEGGGKLIWSAKLAARDVTVEATKSDGKKEKVTAEYRNDAEEGEELRWTLTTVGNFRVYDDGERGTLTYLYPCLLKPLP